MCAQSKENNYHNYDCRQDYNLISILSIIQQEQLTLQDVRTHTTPGFGSARISSLELCCAILKWRQVLKGQQVLKGPRTQTVCTAAPKLCSI
jgi:hypothetical protein